MSDPHNDIIIPESEIHTTLYCIKEAHGESPVPSEQHPESTVSKEIEPIVKIFGIHFPKPQPLRRDYQFKKSGLLSSVVTNPWAPCIMKPPPVKPIIDVLNNNTVTMNKILQTIRAPLDCPIDVIKEINALTINERRKALYYKALYQSIHSYDVPTDFTLAKMYNKYYLNAGPFGDSYTVFEKNIIRNCKDNNGFIIDLYKREFYTFSKWN